MGSEVMTGAGRRAGVLPAWMSVLVVVAHPDDESFGLGAILDAFTRAGAGVEVLCLTQGEASTLHGTPGDLASVRRSELAAAAEVLGVTRALLLDHPDGALSEVPVATLVAAVVAAAESSCAEGVVAFDTAGVTGHPDHVAATSVALLAAERLDLPILGWTLPQTVAAQLNRELGASFIGHQDEEIDLWVGVDRTRQRLASHAHASQALPSSVLWRRLELLGDIESLRWLRPPTSATGDQDDVHVRGHVDTVDQSVRTCGDDPVPTPTQLFAASLASLVVSLCAPIPGPAEGAANRRGDWTRCSR